MALFGQLSFAVDGRSNQFTNQVARRDRQYSFDVFEDRTNTPSPDPLAPDFQYPDTAPTRAKRPLTDITKAAYNGVQPAKKRGRPFGAKSGKRAPPVNANPSPYNPRPPSRIPVPARRSERLTKRPPPSSQNLPQDDNTEDELLAAPPLARPHRSLIPPEPTVEDVEETEEEDESEEDDEERPQPPLTMRQKRAKKVIRRAGPRNRHNGRSLGPDYFTARRPGHGR